jgi:hypothetical protein
MMVKIELTENQLADLKSVLDYVCEVNSEHYLECMDDGVDTTDHVYTLSNNLRALTWEKV